MDCGWIHGWVDGWIHGCVHQWIDGWMDAWMGSWILLHHGHHPLVHALGGVQAPVVVEVVPVGEVLVVHDAAEAGQQALGLPKGGHPVVPPAPHGHRHRHVLDMVKGRPQLARGNTPVTWGSAGWGVLPHAHPSQPLHLVVLLHVSQPVVKLLELGGFCSLEGRGKGLIQVIFWISPPPDRDIFWDTLVQLLKNPFYLFDSTSFNCFQQHLKIPRSQIKRKLKQL